MDAALGPLACHIVAVLGPEIVLTPNVGYKPVHPTYKKCASDVEIVFIVNTKSVHPIYEKCASDLQSVHPTYKKYAADLQKVAADLQKVASDLQ